MNNSVPLLKISKQEAISTFVVSKFINIMDIKKINFYFGMLLLIEFLFTGYYLVTRVVAGHEGDFYLRMANRANHIYLLFIALLNIAYYKCNFSEGKSWLESLSRVLLIVSGITAGVGFYIETNASIAERMIVPTAVGLAFFSILAFIIHELPVKKRHTAHK